MSPKWRIVDLSVLINDFASWLKRVLVLALPTINAAMCLVYFSFAKSLLPPNVALATFVVLFAIGLGPRNTWLKLLRVILGSLFDGLGSL